MLVACVALLPAPGWAQETTGTAVQELVVTASALGASAGTDAASAGVAGADRLANRPLERTGELLEVVPGLIVTQHSGDGKANQYFLRGFDLDHGTDFATSVDGVPVNMPTHAHGQGYTDLNFLIPELVAGLSYRKGPYYADVGDFAAAGAADIQLKRRLDSGLLSVSAGEYGYQRVLAAGSTPLGSGDLLVAAQGGYQDGPWVLPERYRSGAALLSYSAGERSGGFTLESLLYGGRWGATDQVPLRAVEDGALSRFGYVDPSDGGVTHRYSLGASFWRRFGAAELAASVYALDYFLDLFSDFTYFLDPVHGDQFEQDDRRHVYGGDLRWRQPLTASGATVLSAGLQVREDDIEPVALYDTTARVRWRTVSTTRVHEHHHAGYFSFAAALTSWSHLNLGARLDSFRFGVAANLPANSGAASVTVASPKATLVLGPWRNAEYFVNFGRGFHSNDARGTTLSVNPGDGVTPVPRVSPVARAWGAELGVRATPLPELELSASLWTLKLASELTLDADASSIEPSAATRRYGLELTALYRPAPPVLVNADFAFTHARYFDYQPDGQFLPNSLSQVVSVGMALNRGTGLFGGVQLRYLGPAPITQDDTVRSHSSLLVSLDAGYHLTAALTATLSLYNLFNRQDDDIAYYYASRLRSESAPVEDIHFHPAEPRTLRANLAWRF
ncbi:MAG TPA: TonB-dependent receptor plug domain-containing protein [Candidatus Dormibacteraeota bacterium]|nr:TonB-dependent receptor plug domain-containing protein [Candidatus Dormibacteraeota bacterium]